MTKTEYAKLQTLLFKTLEAMERRHALGIDEICTEDKEKIVKAISRLCGL